MHIYADWFIILKILVKLTRHPEKQKINLTDFPSPLCVKLDL